MSTSPTADEGAFHPVLRDRLQAPVMEGGLGQLAAIWKVTTITVRCRPPPGLEDGPWLTGALRGALGSALSRRPPPPPLVPGPTFDRPRAFDVLFRPQGMWTASWEAPKPFVLRTDRSGGLIDVSASLFGFADYWAPEVQAGLIDALRGGVSIAESGAVRAPFAPEGVELRQRTGRTAPVLRDRAGLAILTPLAFRIDRAVVGSLGGFLPAVLRRLDGLARWHDSALRDDDGVLAAAAGSVSVEDIDLTPVAWRRRSGVQGGREIPMAGLIGRFELCGPLTPFAAALAMAEDAHVGHGAAGGMGRFALLE